jgi:hypothetical protein
MKQIILSQEQLNNLSVFLDRVQMQGIKESVAFNAILMAVEKASDLKETKTKK